MTALLFTIHFKTPFAVTAGQTGDGVDARVDPDQWLPASSLKGLLRAEAEHELRIPAWLVEEVFGSSTARRGGSPWAWSDAEFDTQATSGRRARIKIIDDGRSDEGNLLVAEYVWATSATFTVESQRPMTDDDAGRHRLVLRAAARSVTSLGAARRRGQGWVSITDQDDWTAADTKWLHQLMTGQAS